MKTIFYINDTPANRISFWHYVAFLITLPFDYFYNQLVVVSLALHTLIHIKKTVLPVAFRRVPFVVMLPLLLGILGMLYSSDQAEAAKLMGRQIVMVVLPLVMSFNGLNLYRYKHRLLQWFAAAGIATILYLYTDAIHIILFYHLPLKQLLSPAFMNHNFSLPIGLHATYLSLYAALSFIVLLYYFMRSRDKYHRVGYAIGLMILSAGLLQLSSRAVCIALLIMVNGVFPFMVLAGRVRIRFIGCVLLLSVMVLAGISQTSVFRERYFSELRKDVTDQRYNDELTDPRMARWSLAVDIVKQAPLIGHGSGAEVRLLTEAYFTHRLYSSYVNAFNAHSQYLSMAIKTGLLGLLVYLLVLYDGMRRAIRQRDTGFAAFMVLVVIVSFGENLLDVNKGIFFYSFFFSFFLLSQKPQSAGDQATMKPVPSLLI